MFFNYKKLIYHLLVFVGICAFIMLIKHSLIYPNTFIKIMYDFFNVIIGVIEAFYLTDFFIAISKLPSFVFLFLCGFIIILIGYVVLNVFNRKIRYSYELFQNNFSQVLKKGLIFYLCESALILVFIYSIIGIPFAAVIILISAIVSIYGAVPLGIAVGENIQDIFHGNARRLSYNYILGSIFLLIIMNVYVVGVAFLLFFIPVFSKGIVFYTMEMKLFKKPADSAAKKEIFDKRKINDIITKNLD